MLEIEPAHIALLAATALVASAVAAVAGFGGAIMLLPPLVLVFGPRHAVPILTIAQLVGNGSRVWLNRREVDWRVVRWYSVGGIPLALVGGVLFASAPLPWLTRGIGAFLILVVAYRRLARAKYPRIPARGFVAVGAVASLLSSLVGSTGPVTAPFFLSYGLVKGAYIGTEAAATVVTHVFKLVAYGSAGLLTMVPLAAGLLLAPFMIVGSWLGKRVLDRLSDERFVAVIEAVMVVAGAALLWRG